MAQTIHPGTHGIRAAQAPRTQEINGICGINSAHTREILKPTVLSSTTHYCGLNYFYIAQLFCTYGNYFEMNDYRGQILISTY